MSNLNSSKSEHNKHIVLIFYCNYIKTPYIKCDLFVKVKIKIKKCWCVLDILKRLVAVCPVHDPVFCFLCSVSSGGEDVCCICDAPPLKEPLVNCLKCRHGNPTKRNCSCRLYRPVDLNLWFWISFYLSYIYF